MSEALISSEVAGPRLPPPFPTYAELMCQHRGLMRRFSLDSSGEPPNDEPLSDDVKLFVQRVAATGRLLDDEDERLECQQLINYWTTRHHRLGGGLLDLPLAPFDAESAPILPDESYPYGRLAALQACESARLFGCARLLHESLVRLRDVGMLVLIGTNGSGRSRFIDCVLIPALRNDEIDGSKNWRIVPTFEPGDEPLERLATAILGSEADAALVESAAQQIRNDVAALANLINKHETQPLLLVIDHFEQLFTRCAPETRLALAANLYGAVREADPPCRVVIMLNRRYASHLSQLKVPKADWVAAELLFSFAPHELREAIVEPAQTVGLKFDPGLIDRLVMDVQGDPAALSLLQFQLEHLWKARKRNRITWEAYRELGGGGLALERKAEQLYAQLDGNEQSLVRHILLQMVQLDAIGDISTQARRLSELGADNPTVRDEVLSKLISAGIIRRTPDGTDEDPQFNVAHDALITHWPRLTGWIEEMRLANRHRLQFNQQAEDWFAAGKPKDRLWRGLQLEEAKRFKHLTPIETEFIRAGVHRKRLLALLRSVAIFAIALSVVITLVTRASIAQQDAANLLRQRVVESIEDGDVAGAAILAAELETDREMRSVLDVEAPSLVRVVTPNDKSETNWITGMAAAEPAPADVARRIYLTLGSNRPRTDQSTTYVNSLGFLVVDDASESLETFVLYEAFKTSPDAEAVAVRATGPNSVVVACNKLSNGQKTAQLRWCDDASFSLADFKPLRVLDSLPKGRSFEGADSLETSGDCLLTITHEVKGKKQLHAWCTGDDETFNADAKFSQMQFQWYGDKTTDVLECVAKARLSRDGEWLMTIASANPDDAKALEPPQLSWWKRDKDKWIALDMPQWVIDRLKNNSEYFKEWGWLPKLGDRAAPPCWENLDSHLTGLTIHQAQNETQAPECITCAHDGEVLFWSVGPPLVKDGKPTFQPTLNKRLDVGVSVYDAVVIDAQLGDSSSGEVPMKHKVLATCSRDRTMRFWDVKDQDELAPRMDHGATVEQAVILSPTGAIATLAGGSVRIWKVPTSLMPHSEVSKHFTQLGPRGSEAARPLTGDLANEKDAPFIDLDEALASIMPSLVAFDVAKPVAADHQLFVDAGGQWNLVLRNLMLPKTRIKHLAYSSKERLLIVSGSYEDDVAANRWGFTSLYTIAGELVTTIHHNEEALYADVSDHGLLATCDVHNTVRIIDVSEKNRGTIPKKVELRGEPDKLRNVPPLLATLKHTSDVTFAAFASGLDRDAWRLATVSSDGEAHLWDAQRQTVKDDVAQYVPISLAHDAKVSTAEFDASGQFVVTASRDKTARIWRIEPSNGRRADLVGILRHPLPLERAWFLETPADPSRTSSLPDIVTVYATATGTTLADGATAPKRYFARRWNFDKPNLTTETLQRLAEREFDDSAKQLILLDR